jgi:hypothetical protein
MKLVKSTFDVIVEGVLISKRGMSTSKLTSQLNSSNTKKRRSLILILTPNVNSFTNFKAHLTFQLLLDP